MYLIFMFLQIKCKYIFMCMYRHIHKFILAYYKTVWTDSPVYVCLPQRRCGQDGDHHRPGCAAAAAKGGERGGHQRICAQNETTATTHGADRGKHSWLNGQVWVHNAGYGSFTYQFTSSLLVGTLTLRQRMRTFSSSRLIFTLALFTRSHFKWLLWSPKTTWCDHMWTAWMRN